MRITARAAISTIILLIISTVLSCSSVTTLRLANLPARYIDKGSVMTSFYMPEARLIEDARSVIGWDRRLTDRFSFTRGDNYVLHIEHAHYDRGGGVIDPDYSYQVNLEIPAHLFREGERIPAAAIEGFMVWGGEYTIYRREYSPIAPNMSFVPSERGYLTIKRIGDDKTLLADVNLYFKDPRIGEPIRVFGKIIAPMKTRAQFHAEEVRAKQRIYERARGAEKEAWSPKWYNKMGKF